MTDSVQSAAARATDHPLVERGARLGYAASGVLHLLIAWVTLQLAWTTRGDAADSGGQQTDQQGALRELAGGGAGTVLLWVLLVGFVLLALWNLASALAWGEAADRAKAGAKAVVYGVLGWTTWSVVRSGQSGEDSGQQTSSFTASLLAGTGGRVLVGAVGLAVVGVGAYHVHKGWTRKFLQDLASHPGHAAETAGRIGYVAKGVALAVVGALFVVAAVRARADQAQGLDGALHALAALPFGAVLLTLVGLGFAAYGVYAFARARHARV